MYFAFNEENGEFVYFEFDKYTKFVLQTPHDYEKWYQMFADSKTKFLTSPKPQ